MKSRVFQLVLGVIGPTLVTALAGPSAHAQALPLPPLPGGSLADLAANPGQWLTVVVNGALVAIGHQTITDVVGFMGWLLGSGNLIAQTPPSLSYDSEAVRRLWDSVRLVADAGLGVVAVWGGINIKRRATHIKI